MNTSSQAKKSRLLWSSQLHSRFLAAVNVLGVDSATPSQILELMNVEFLTREQVKSHLQKYKLNLNRTEEAASKKNNNPDTDRKTSLLEKLKLIEGTLQSSRLEREKLEVQLNQQKVLAAELTRQKAKIIEELNTIQLPTASPELAGVVEQVKSTGGLPRGQQATTSLQPPIEEDVVLHPPPPQYRVDQEMLGGTPNFSGQGFGVAPYQASFPSFSSFGGQVPSHHMYNEREEGETVPSKPAADAVPEILPLVPDGALAALVEGRKPVEAQLPEDQMKSLRERALQP